VAGVSHDSADRREHVLNTVVKFSIQRALILLSAFALRHIDVGAYLALRTPISPYEIEPRLSIHRTSPVGRTIRYSALASFCRSAKAWSRGASARSRSSGCTLARHSLYNASVVPAGKPWIAA